MKIFTSGYLLYTLALMLMNQQTLWVEAKPFLLLPPNFFVLTTRAPCSACTSAFSGSANTNIQIPNLIAPKLRFLSTLLQGLATSASANNNNANAGGVSIVFKKFGFIGPATTTTTTTIKPVSTTEPSAVFMPDTAVNPSTTTEESKTTSTSPATTSTSTTESSLSTNLVFSSRVGTDDEDNSPNTTEREEDNFDNATDTTDNEQENIDNTTNYDDNTNDQGDGLSNGNVGSNGNNDGQGYRYESSTSSTQVLDGISIRAGDQSSNGNDNIKTIPQTRPRFGYRYTRPAPNQIV